MATSSTTATAGNLIALRGGFRSSQLRAVISESVGHALDEAGVVTGVRRRALERADTLIAHLRYADAYLLDAGILRSKDRPRAIVGQYVEHITSARLQLRLVSRADAEPRLAELEERLGRHFAALTAHRDSPLGANAAPWLAVYRRIADELARLAGARVSKTRSRGLEDADRGAEAEQARDELHALYVAPHQGGAS